MPVKKVKKVDKFLSKAAKQSQAVSNVSMKSLIDNLELVDINKVNLWEDNPRKNDQNVDNVARSISEHGFRSPLVVWRKNGVVYKGNTTLKAALKLGLNKVPVSYQDFPSETAATAYGISDNKTSEGSKWDEEILSRLMKAPEFTEDIERTKRLTGLKDKELNVLLEKMEAPEEFPTYKETLKTQHICPKCGYEWD